MRRSVSVKLATLLAVIVLLALVVPAGPFGTVRAEIPLDCRFWGPVTVVGTRVDAGTEITVSLDPDPLVGPSWTTTTFLVGRGGVPYYVIDIPMEDFPEPGGVEGDTLYFTVTGVTYLGNTFPDTNLSGPDGTWTRASSVYHPLRVGTTGDVNMDGGVPDQDDVDMLWDIIMGNKPATPAADVNQDGVVNIKDIWELLSIINP